MAKKKNTQAPPVPDWFKAQFRNRYFVCYLDWRPILGALESAEDYKRVMEAAFEYAGSGTAPDLTGINNIVFLSLKKDMDKDFEHAVIRGWKAYCAEEDRRNTDAPAPVYEGTPAPADGRAPAITHNTQHSTLNTITHNNNNNNNNQPTNPTHSHTPAHGGMGRSVGSSDNPPAQKPASFSELENYLSSIGYPDFDAAALWYEMQETDWQIQDKTSGTLRPLKSWKNFVKYRAEHHINTPQEGDPAFATPEDKALFEQYQRTGAICSFEDYKKAKLQGGQDWN